MYKVKYTSQFKKDYKLAKKQGKEITKIEDIIKKLSKGELLAPKHKDHELSGNFKGFRECHVEADWLLVYLVEDKILTLTLTRTGSHSDLF